MDSERAKSVARGNKTTPKAVREAVQRGVDEYDLDDFFYARSLSVVSIEQGGSTYAAKPTVAQVAGMYRLCNGDVQVLMELAEDAQVHVQSSMRQLYEEGILDAEDLVHGGRQLREYTKIELSQYLANRYDERLDREASIEVQAGRWRTIDGARSDLYRGYGIASGIERTPLQLQRARRRLLTTAFEDVHRDTSGLPRDFDLQAGARLIEDDICAAEELQNRYNLSGKAYRVAAQLLLDPDLPFEKHRTGEYQWGGMGITNDRESAILLGVDRRVRDYFGLMVSGVIASEKALHVLLRTIRKDAGMETVADEEMSEEELCATIKSRFLALLSEIKAFVQSSEELWHGYAGSSSEDEDISPVKLLPMTRSRFAAGVTPLLCKKIGRSGVSDAIAQFVPTFPTAIGYEMVCHTFGIDLDCNLTHDDDDLEPESLRVYVQRDWERALERYHQQVEAAAAYARILAGQRDDSTDG